MFYENVIKKALNDPDLTVGSTTIKFDRVNPSSVRPDSLSVKYTIDGETTTVRFKNEPNQLPEIK